MAQDVLTPQHDISPAALDEMVYGQRTVLLHGQAVEAVDLNGHLVPKPDAVKVHYYVQDKKPEPKQDDRALEFPHHDAKGLSVVPFTVTDPQGNPIGQLTDASAPSAQLTAQQFKALYEAVAAQSGWVPPDCVPGNEFFDQFKDANLHMLVKDGKPIGFSSVEGNYDGNPDRAALNYIGVIPSEQGKGSGYKLFNYMVDKAWSLPGVKAVQLDTVPTHDLAKNGETSASALYERNGFKLDGAEEKSVATSPPDKWRELNFPKAYEAQVEQATGHTAGRQEVAKYFESALHKSGIDKAVAQLNAPAQEQASAPAAAAQVEQPELTFASVDKTNVGIVSTPNTRQAVEHAQGMAGVWGRVLDALTGGLVSGRNR